MCSTVRGRQAQRAGGNAAPSVTPVRIGESARAAMDGCFGAMLMSPADAIARVGWRPDDPEAYCHRCGDTIGAGELTERGCAACRQTGGFADGIVRLGTYSGPLRQWVRSIKYQPRWREMAWRLGELLGQAVLEESEQLEQIKGRPVWVVPVPSSRIRRLHRGIDHSSEIARGVARAMHAPLRPLLMGGGGRPQVHRSPTDRRRHGGRGFRIRRRMLGLRSAPDLEGRVVLVLVDDVRTTGATINRARRRLERLNPAAVIGAVLSVSDATARRIRASAAAKA